MTVDLGRVFLGVVEDNNDPDRENKCKIRVINIFDGIPVEDLPWATPWKDTNGIMSDLPDTNKIVSVEFENGDIYSPVYRYAEHYNINLENKLKDLSKEDYLTMKASQFDHRTQVYSNESEGLKLDFKYNLLNITNNTIDLNLKSNLGKINIGTAAADQQAILGNNFLDWFDDFVSHLLGEKGGPYFGNLYAPIIPHPGLIAHLAQYKVMKDPKFLSHNSSFNDNGDIEKIERPSLSDLGDDWKSTTENRSDAPTHEQQDYSVSYKTHSDSEVPEESGTASVPVIDPDSETPNADSVREVMSTLGYTENGSEMSNGGDLSKKMAKYTINVFNKIKELYPTIKVKVTSGNDTFHQGLDYNSRHKKGNALDFVISPANRNDIKNVYDVLKGYAAAGNRRARFLNEYASPTRAATGFHFHLSWGNGTEGDDEINNAIAEANSGLINTYNIV
tara:strand:+ start:631 stop:1974 length:1344 start_codon:yes stop_codon:yes gene_type:complete